MPICREFTGATGLEPATSGVTDRRSANVCGPLSSVDQAGAAAQGAPNVLIVLIDDVGFGAPSAFGGPIRTPTAARLAANGLNYTRFHTTALCSPTRAVLLSGRNHHTVGMGGITEIATAAAPAFPDP